MRKKSFVSSLIPYFLFLIFVSSLIPLFSSLAFCRQAILSHFTGTVEVQAKGSTFWRKANPKMLLKEGEKVRTGKRSKATLLFEDGSRTEVMPETTLAMTQLVAPVNLEQSAGRTRNKISKAGRGFALRTPTAVCSVRGTDFSVGVAEGGETKLDVYEGVVNGLKTATGESLDVGAGQSLSFTTDAQPLGTPQPIETPKEESALKNLAKKEVGLDMTREQIQAAAAEEMKLAEYQEGKSLIDVNGARVRLEEYILRKPKDVAEADRDKAFKFVVLNTREALGNRIDFFTYKGIFNKTLPDDLSIALRNVTGRKLGDEPEFYLRSYEMNQSNLTDALKDMADGGHLVEVTFDGTTYTLKAHGVGADGKAGAVTDQATQQGTANGKTYDPVADVYKNAGAGLDGIYDSADDSFKTMKQGDTLWRTVFNRYGHLLGSAKDLASLTLDNVPAAALLATTDANYAALPAPWFQYYTKNGVQNIATLESLNNAAVTSDGTLSARGKSLDLIKDQDIGNARFRTLNGHYAFDSSFPSGVNNLNIQLVTYYPKSSTDIPFEQYDTFIISDEGKIAPTAAFANATSGKAFKQELIKWNYEQIARSSAFGGTADNLAASRTIDIVVEPKILIRSGLIK